ILRFAQNWRRRRDWVASQVLRTALSARPISSRPPGGLLPSNFVLIPRSLREWSHFALCAKLAEEAGFEPAEPF
ncbi:MAG: hypothetical protein ACLFS4_04615, partial [Opitutales bacterium]